MRVKIKIEETNIGRNIRLKKLTFKERVNEWLECAIFIRKAFSLRYPSFFDGQIKREIEDYLRRRA